MIKVMTKEYRNFISKPEISFWIPIISSCIMIAGSWFTLSNRIDLLTQKVDTLIVQNEKLMEKYAGVEDRYGKLSIQITRLETMEGLRPIK